MDACQKYRNNEKLINIENDLKQVFSDWNLPKMAENEYKILVTKYEQDNNFFSVDWMISDLKN